MMQLIEMRDFQTTVEEYYSAHGRHDLPWRQPEPNGSFDPYKIMVSELMLQQTQVSRVLPKYEQFLQAFPSLQALAAAEIGDVLRAWSGLGYNRRAKFLHAAAQQLVQTYDGTFPTTQTELVQLPGVGKNTAGAILAYAFNQPAVFIETNIRTIFIHHFFADAHAVADHDLMPLVAAALKGQEPRSWYWALMDYGSFLKRSVGNLSRSSKHYAKQSTFAGSKRQIRGAVIRALSEQPYTLAELQKQINDTRLETVLDDLLNEALIKKKANRYLL